MNIKAGDFLAKWVEIYLDGKRQELVDYADDLAGVVLRMKRKPNGKPVVKQTPNGPMAIREVVRGKVELRLREDTPEFTRTWLRACTPMALLNPETPMALHGEK